MYVPSEALNKKINLEKCSDGQKKIFKQMQQTSLGVLNPRPTFLVYLSAFSFVLPIRLFLFKKTVGCFWNDLSLNVWNCI